MLLIFQIAAGMALGYFVIRNFETALGLAMIVGGLALAAGVIFGIVALGVVIWHEAYLTKSDIRDAIQIIGYVLIPFLAFHYLTTDEADPDAARWAVAKRKLTFWRRSR